MVHACKKHTHRHTHTHLDIPFSVQLYWHGCAKVQQHAGRQITHAKTLLATSRHTGWPQEAGKRPPEAGDGPPAPISLLKSHVGHTMAHTRLIDLHRQALPRPNQHTRKRKHRAHIDTHTRTHTHTPPKHSFFVQVCRHTCAGVQKHTGHQITHAKTLLTAGRHRLAKAGVSCAPAAPHGPPMASCQLPARVSLRQHLPGLPMLRELMGQATVHGSSILILM